jgi:CelD/BcsL family acetyltransferase involved in cellulose biosynthesis
VTVIDVVSPAPRDAWRRALAADPDAVATQTPEWLDCLCRVRGYRDASRLYELPGGRTLVLPLAARTWGGVRVAEESWPYGWGYGGALATGRPLTRDDARLVLADLAARPLVRAGVVPLPLAAQTWAAAAAAGGPRPVRRVPYLTQVVDLDGGFGTVWSTRYRRQARTAVRKAERCDLEVRRDHAAGLAAFAALHRQSVDRWARQRRQPRWAARLLAGYRDRPGQLGAVTRALGGSCVIWSAYRAGEPVAVNVVLRSGRHSLGWLSAMDRTLARETQGTYLLQSLAIEDSCAAGARYFHLGESDPGSGVERYKRHFGAVPLGYHALRFERVPLTRTGQALRAVARRPRELT